MFNTTQKTLKNIVYFMYKASIIHYNGLIYSSKVLVIPRNRWLRLNMTEKLFTGTLNHNQNKTKNYNGLLTPTSLVFYYLKLIFPCSSRKYISLAFTIMLFTLGQCLQHAQGIFLSPTSLTNFFIRKPAFCICENKDADQLRGSREADQRLCFRYTDSTIPLLHNTKFLVSSRFLCLYSQICVRPRRKLRRQIFSGRDSFTFHIKKVAIFMFLSFHSWIVCVQS